jgi:hypothetical protein
MERGDGSRGVLRVSVAPIRTARGEVAAGVVVFDDITNERRAQEATRRLLELTTDLAAATSVEQVARVIVEHGTRALGATLGVVALVSRDGSALEVAHAQGYPAAVVERLRRVELAARWPMTDAVRTREPVFIDALVSARHAYPGLVEVWRQTGSHSECVHSAGGGWERGGRARPELPEAERAG